MILGDRLDRSTTTNSILTRSFMRLAQVRAVEFIDSAVMRDEAREVMRQCERHGKISDNSSKDIIVGIE